MQLHLIAQRRRKNKQYENEEIIYASERLHRKPIMAGKCESRHLRQKSKTYITLRKISLNVSQMINTGFRVFQGCRAHGLVLFSYSQDHGNWKV